MNNNIINEYINFTRISLKNYAKMILVKDYNNDIFEQVLKIYIDIRYFNFGEKIHDEFSLNVVFNLFDQITNKKKIKGDDELVEKTFKIFKYLIYFDNVLESASMNETIKELSAFRKKELGIQSDEKFADELFALVRDDLFDKKDFLDKHDDENFTLNYILTDIDNVFDTYLEHNLKFPKLYNATSINKVFNSKEISEKRLFIEYTYVVITILKDIIKGEFDKKYLLNYVSELNNKKNTLNGLMKIISHDIAKEKTSIKITYHDFNENKELFYTNMRSGFNYAIIIDDEFILDDNSLQLLSVFKYIIINHKNMYYKDLSDLDNIIVLR